MTDRASYLVQSDFDRLEDWCRMVRVIFGSSFGPYLVGSATERADYRDVDIRVLMRDRDFDAVFRRRPEAVRFLNRAISVWGQQETGLPIDFQVQRQTEANAEFDKPRNAMGVRDWTRIPTSGVPGPGRKGFGPKLGEQTAAPADVGDVPMSSTGAVAREKDPRFVESGRRAARVRWGEQRILRLDTLTAEQRRLVLALVAAARESQPDRAA